VPDDCRWDGDDEDGAMNADDLDGTVTYMPGDEIAPEHEKEVSSDPWFRVWGLGSGVWGLGSGVWGLGCRPYTCPWK
jgi:hypothetical protein